MTFSVAASTAVPGSVWTVCIAASAGGGAGSTFAIVGGVGGQLRVARATSVSPLGLAVPVSAATTLTVSGSGLSSSDVVKLVVVRVAPASSCTDANDGTQVMTTFVTQLAADGSLVMSTSSAITTGASYLVCIQYGGAGLFYGLSNSSANQFSAVVASQVSPTQYALASNGQVTLTISGSGLSVRDTYYAVNAGDVCTGTKVTAVSIGASLQLVSGATFGTQVTVVAAISDNSGRTYRVCVRPGGEPNESQAIAVASGQQVSAVVVQGFSPRAVPAVSGVAFTISGQGFPVGLNLVTIKIVVGSDCSGSLQPLSFSAPTTAAGGTQVTFTVDASSAVVGTNRMVCIDVTTGANAGTTFSAVGSSGVLRVVDAQSVSPRGVAAPVYAATPTTLVLSGSGLTASDSVKLVPQTAGGALCSSTGGQVLTQGGVIVNTSQLQVRLSSDITTGGQYVVCIQYNGEGAFYGLSNSVANQFSVVTTSSVLPAQYQFAGVQTLYVNGAGLSTLDVYYAVASTDVCTGTNLAPAVSISSPPSMVTFGTSYAISVSISGSVGVSYRLCLRPGGEPSNALAASVANGTVVSALSVASFLPTGIPRQSGVQMTINGNGFPISNGVTVSVVNGACSGSSLPVSVTSVTDTRVIFTLDASGVAVGSNWTVCLAASVNAGAPTFAIVGSASSLQVAEGQSVSPVGLPVSSIVSGTTVLTIGGVSLSASDTVKLVRIDTSSGVGVVSCSNTNSGGEVSTSSPSLDGVTGSLSVTISGTISSGALYRVCVQYRTQGLFYGLSTTSMFSALSVTNVSPTQYNMQSVATMTVTGSGLTSQDTYFAVVSSAASCTGTKATDVTIDTVSVTTFNTQATVSVRIPSLNGQSFRVCVRPSGNAVDASSVFVSSVVSAVAATMVSPTAVPTQNGISMTISGGGFPVGTGSVVIKVSLFVC